MSTQPSARVLVVIVSWNTRELLRRCLRALLAGTRSTLEVWLVDNGSADGSADMVRAEFPEVHLIAGLENLGFAAANNRALRAAGQIAPYVLLLNPDTEIEPGSVDALADHLDSAPTCGAVGVQLTNPDGSLQRSFEHFWFNRPLLSFLRNHVPGMRERGTVPAPRPGDGARRVDWAIGACLMLRGEALSRVGLLDESFRIYGEEVDLQWRLRQAGYDAALLAGVHVLHHGGQSTRQAAMAMTIEEHRGRYLLLRKHAGSALRALYVVKVVTELAISLPWQALRAALSPSARRGLRARLSLLREHLRPDFYRTPLAPPQTW